MGRRQGVNSVAVLGGGCAGHRLCSFADAEHPPASDKAKNAYYVLSPLGTMSVQFISVPTHSCLVQSLGCRRYTIDVHQPTFWMEFYPIPTPVQILALPVSLEPFCISAGTHSLRYYYLSLSEPGPGLPQFLAVGYVDDQPFIRFDSRVSEAKPQASWMAPVDTQYWETETQKHRAWAKMQQVEMWRVMGYYNQSSGMHSTQRMFGCEIQEDGSSNGFWQFGYDGQDHVTLDLETLSWVSAQPVALQTKRRWEMEPCYAEYDKAYLEGLCLISLRRYLELGSRSLTRREPPVVQVTRHPTQDSGYLLRCWALGFYPRDISLSWWLGEEELTLETERVETRPSGDGTYQTWAAVWVPEGEETSYICHVQHSSLNHTLTVAWESSSPPGLVIAIFTSLATVLLVVGIVIFTKRCLQGRWGRNKGDPPTGPPPQGGMLCAQPLAPNFPHGKQQP
ncbi:Class I histocompatibility antigen, Gogo-C*0101/C*0102 alpha chain [Galemys pyrenaicus]|uniref:Class I histocompatibility antigen, Gogo-C*0101/C*0102 alpha chain n=1 Tax=Galemys pyrenaicus TaxID=202257 RepID=A0A8J6AEP3_GALPY|nr:Class I histocompatibility antigen, Gogo-C*0101/C*0102 alpha chain [Galemys pyrenaicus]